MGCLGHYLHNLGTFTKVHAVLIQKMEVLGKYSETQLNTNLGTQIRIHESASVRPVGTQSIRN